MGIVNISGVGKTGVGKMGQMIGETGVGEMGVGETGTSQIWSHRLSQLGFLEWESFADCTFS